MWREMMLHHLDHESDPARRLQTAEALLSGLASQYGTKEALKPHAKLLEGQLKLIRESGGNWFFHDDLGPVFEPLSIADFGAELATYGLAYAGDALFENLRPREYLPESLAPADWLETEQYADFFAGRGFRNSLVTLAGVPAVHPPPADVFERLFYAAPLRKARSGAVTTFRNEWTKGEAEVADPVLTAALDGVLKAWPDNLSYDELRLQPETLLELMANEVIAPSVSPRALPKQAGDRPETWAPARMQAARGKVVTSRLHGAVQLEQDDLRRLVIAMDGTRTRQELRELCGQRLELGTQLEWLRRAALLA
jgi:Predicted methyltransferase regulatory domain